MTTETLPPPSPLTLVSRTLPYENGTELLHQDLSFRMKILTIADRIASQPTHFDLAVWFKSPGGDRLTNGAVHTCGSVGCVAGWIVNEALPKGFHTHSVESAPVIGRRWLELDLEHSSLLFVSQAWWYDMVVRFCPEELGEYDGELYDSDSFTLAAVTADAAVIVLYAVADDPKLLTNWTRPLPRTTTTD